MPTPYSSSRNDGWKHEMNSALKPSSRNDFADGFLHRQAKRNGFGQHQRKSLKSCSFPKRKLFENSNDNDDVSENDFVHGFLQREKKTNGYVQHQAKPSKDYAEPGFKHVQGQRWQADSSSNNKSFSGNDFWDGFVQKCNPETDPCSTWKHSFHEQESLASSNDRNKQSPYANHSKQPSSSVDSTPKRLGFLEHTTKSTEVSGASSTRGRYRWANKSTEMDYSTQITRTKPSTATIKTPSPSTQYISTRTSSTPTSRFSANCHRYLDGSEREWLKSSTGQIYSHKYTREPLTASVQTPSLSTQHISTSTTSGTRFRGCPKMISEAEWKELERKSQHEQKEFLEAYLKDEKFKDVPVSSVTKNVRGGDHIFYPGGGGLYDHHLLCTTVDEDYVHTIEYTGPSVSLLAVSQSVASSNALAFGAIKKGKLKYKELEKKKAKIRKWPKELQRFPIDEVIARAFKREYERDYHAFNNNCEHFVTWCICGLSTSLQVKPFYKLAWESAKGAGVSALGGVPTFLKAVGNVSDEILGAISSSFAPVGFALGGIIETGYAAYNIYEDYKRMNQGHISKEQFKINTVANGSKAVCHIAGAIGGSLIGSVFGPIGSIAGGVIGYGVGHVVSSAVSWSYEHAPTIKKAFQDYVVEPVKKAVNTCVNAVKTVGSALWEGVKGVFSSLFSW